MNIHSKWELSSSSIKVTPLWLDQHLQGSQLALQCLLAKLTDKSPSPHSPPLSQTERDHSNTLSADDGDEDPGVYITKLPCSQQSLGVSCGAIFNIGFLKFVPSASEQGVWREKPELFIPDQEFSQTTSALSALATGSRGALLIHILFINSCLFYYLYLKQIMQQKTSGKIFSI